MRIQWVNQCQQDSNGLERMLEGVKLGLSQWYPSHTLLRFHIEYNHPLESRRLDRSTFQEDKDDS